MARRGLIGLLAAAVVTVGGTPGMAVAATVTTNPISPLLPQSPVTSTQVTPPVNAIPSTTTGGSSSLSNTDAIAIAIGAMLLLGGIGYFIWRDARRRAPVRAHTAEAVAGGRSGSKQRVKPRKLSAAEKRRRKRGRAR